MSESEPMESQVEPTQISIPLEKFTEQSRTVLALAEEEARSLKHNFIGTEHLLLGLLRSTDNLAAVVLANLGIELALAQRAVEHITGRGNETVEDELQMAPRMITVLSISVSQAWQMKESRVGPEHLLLGIVREGEGIAMGILARFGATADKVRAQLLQTVALSRGNTTTEPSSGTSKSNVIACRIDKRDLDAIDALIEAGIRSTRSDAAAWLIHAGIEANQALLEKVYGTVAEIRRLRLVAQELAQEISTSPDEGNSRSE